MYAIGFADQVLLLTDTHARAKFVLVTEETIVERLSRLLCNERPIRVVSAAGVGDIRVCFLVSGPP